MVSRNLAMLPDTSRGYFHVPLSGHAHFPPVDGTIAYVQQTRSFVMNIVERYNDLRDALVSNVLTYFTPSSNKLSRSHNHVDFCI
jgi:hypothetical protein